MNKTAIALSLIIIAISSVLTVSFVHFALVSSSEQESLSTTATSTSITPSTPSATPNQENNSAASSLSQAAPTQSASQSPTPASSNTSTPTQTSSSTDAPKYAPDSAYPEGIRDWLPWGSFGMFSPANQTYTTNNLILNVTGGVISGDSYLPYLSYTLDGGPRVPVPITLTKPEGLTLTFQRIISGSVALPPLSNGIHILVLYGDLEFDSRKGKVTVYFDVEAV